MSIPVESSSVTDQASSSSRPELLLWVQHQEERLQQVVEGGPLSFDLCFFHPVTRAESFPNLQPFFSINHLVAGSSSPQEPEPSFTPTRTPRGCDFPLQTFFYPHGYKYKLIRIGADPDDPHRSTLYCTHLENEAPPFSDIHFHNLNSIFTLRVVDLS